jgi:transposase InsO family protein
MEAHLIKKGLWQPIESARPADAALASAWDDKSKRAKAEIMLNVANHHLLTLKKCATAKDAWTTLENMYKSKITARQLQLRQNINSVKKGTAEPLSKYISRVVSMWNDLTSTDHAMKEHEAVLCTLAGLPKEYDTIATVLTASTDELQFSSVFQQLLAVEQRVSKPEDETKALLARRSGRPFNNFNRSSSGSSRPFSGSSSSRPMGPPRNGGAQGSASNNRDKECYYCGKKGHIKKECRKRQADEKAGTLKQSSKPPVALISATSEASQEDPEVWTLDSGATGHMTPHISLLSNIRAVTNGISVKFGNKEQSRATHTGDIVMKTISGRDIKLTDVLYVPNLWGNLFSVPTATSRGAEFSFRENSCDVKRGDEVLFKAGRQDDLYVFRSSYTQAKTVSALKATTSESAELWHQRFGHLGYKNLAKLPSMVSGINVSSEEITRAGEKAFCEPCVMGKQHRQPFPESETKTTQPLELIHMDVCGPMPVQSLGGNRYFATFLDDYTDLSVVMVVSAKSAVPEKVKEVITYLEKQSGYKVKILRSDRGGEYLNEELDDFCKQHGILHQTTAPYTPQQNGKAERLNRTLMEKARSMLQGASLPPHYGQRQSP